MLAGTVLAGLLMASGAAAACTPRSSVTPGVVIKQCTKPGMLALAYDDGPYLYTSDLVDILDAAGAKATFFWTGTLYGCIYGQAAAVKKAYASGHQIASHTW
jgi:peptidoglycan/xylan/chitin deacetylase (PgdA/CDA1 family)